MKEIIEAIKAANSIILIAHTDPDGDAIGSMLALNMLIKKLEKKAVMYCPEKVPFIYEFLADSGDVKTKVPNGKKYDLAIAVDCGDIRRLGSGIDIKSKAEKLINIDHHPDNTNFGDINLVQSISSVSEIIYDLYAFCGIPVDKNAAECLYVGIMTDTGNFRYDYTTSRTLKIAAELKDIGVDISRIAMMVYENKTIPATRVLGAAMYRLECSGTGKVVWSVLPKTLMDSIGAKSEDLTGIVDQLRSIRGAEVAILFREEEDGVKVNFRSKFKVNVSKIAKGLGGGGHVKASGVVLQGDIEKVKEKVLAEVFKVIK